MNPSLSRHVVVLGMMSRMPAAGVVWQTIQYLIGFQKLGYDVYYVEQHGRTPRDFMGWGEHDGSERAAQFIARTLKQFDMQNCWAFQALHSDGRVIGLSEHTLRKVFSSASLVVNLHGGTPVRTEHISGGPLVYLETDPVRSQVQLYKGMDKVAQHLASHTVIFTFAENYGNTDCKLPVSERFQFLPTRQPVVMGLWRCQAQSSRPVFTTIASWRQDNRVVLDGEVYHWSKHLEFVKFLDLPARTSKNFELALSDFEESDRNMLERRGWRVRSAANLSGNLSAYREYICSARGEFTVAKDQNVRLRTGWFSDRSAAYLASGRPVVTQETAFSNVLPSGEGLFGFSSTEEIVDALDSIDADYRRHSQRAQEIARDCFSYDVVLGKLLREVGL